MSGIIRIQRVALALAALAVLSISVGYRTGFVGAQMVKEDVREHSDKANQEFPVPLDPLPKTITPCRACHGPEKDFKINWTREEILRVHTNIQLNHGGMKVWCLDCHHPQERNFLLPLSDGKLIAFEKSYELCGKCHGTKYRDWRHGIHGKRTGHWNGKKKYHLCTSCHNPHSPQYKPMEPMPPPEKPRTPREAKSSH